MTERILIKNAAVISGGEVQKNICVITEGGKIAFVGTEPDGFCGRVIDGEGAYLSPGFIDIHCHGGGGHDFMDATPEAFIGACRSHARHGTTSILPTTLAGDESELLETFSAYNAAKDRCPDGAQMLGLHLEGPYFSKEFKGAQDERYIVNPDSKQYRRIYEKSGGCIVRWSSAPELEGSAEFARFLSENGIIASVAHSSATYDEVLAAYNNGFRLITHLYSGMSTIVRKDGFRIPGVVESAYLIDGMSAELIADGCHLPPSLLWLACKCKGADRLILVTDAMRAAGMPEGESILGSLKNGQRVIVEKGVAFIPDRTAFAGSVCTADRLVRTMTKSAGVPLTDAVKMITYNPAKLIGVECKKGVIAPGADADLLLFDGDIKIKMTMISGNIICLEN